MGSKKGEKGKEFTGGKSLESSLKAYYKEFRKVNIRSFMIYVHGVDLIFTSSQNDAVSWSVCDNFILPSSIFQLTNVDSM